MSDSVGIKLAIVGSRHYNNYAEFKQVVNKFVGNTIGEIVSGGAPGADTLAEYYAQEYGIKITVYKAEWNVYGRSAGPIRNAKIVKHCDEVLAFVAPTSTGTKHTINLARQAGKKVTEIAIK